jgi:cytochrome c-type biogenesis protein CcmE
VRVGGDVAVGSVERVGKQVRFVLKQDKQDLKVVYSGLDPLPDTFRDGAQALADGKLDRDGTFHATRIQAKCASKYEAKPSLQPGQALPNINNGPKTSI